MNLFLIYKIYLMFFQYEHVKNDLEEKFHGGTNVLLFGRRYILLHIFVLTVSILSVHFPEDQSPLL